MVSSVYKSISALQEHCTKVVHYVHDILCPGVQQHWPPDFSRFVKSILTGEVNLIIAYFFYVFLLENLEQF